MTPHNDSIELRLEVFKKDYHKNLVAAAHQTARTSSPAMPGGGLKKPYLKASTIAPSKKNRQLMRQVSALGMEDPIFGTTEDGPKHPSNIFDDMSISDVPADMRDMVSVASDPTADFGLGSFRKSSVHDRPIEESEASLSEESMGLEGMAGGEERNEPRGTCHPFLRVEVGRTTSHKSESSGEKSHLSYPPKPSAHLLEKLNASIQSLPSLTLEDAMDAGMPPTPPMSRKQSAMERSHKTLGQSKTSITSNTASMTERTERDETIARMAKRLVCPRKKQNMSSTGIYSSSSPNLKYHHAAPRVPQRQPTNDEDMLQIYSQAVKKREFSMSTASGAAALPPPPPPTDYAPSALHRGDSIYQPVDQEMIQQWAQERGVTSLNSSLLVAQPDNMHIPPTQPGMKGDEPLAKSRAMPNISNLFPVDGAAVSKRSRSRRTKTKPSSASTTPDSSHTRPDTISEMSPLSGIDTTSVRAVCRRTTNSVYTVHSK